MISKKYYIAPEAEIEVLELEQSLALSYNENNQTETMIWDDDELDL